MLHKKAILRRQQGEPAPAFTRWRFAPRDLFVSAPLRGMAVCRHTRCAIGACRPDADAAGTGADLAPFSKRAANSNLRPNADDQGQTDVKQPVVPKKESAAARVKHTYLECVC